MAAHRLRIQAFTLVAGTVEEELDLTGLQQVAAIFASTACTTANGSISPTPH